MAESLVAVTVRIPASVVNRAKQLAVSQDRTIQAVYARALRLGMDVEEERERIACEAIKAVEGRRPPPAPRT